MEGVDMAGRAGNASRVWRYFESVPDSMDSMRTHEAIFVADRHLR